MQLTSAESVNAFCSFVQTSVALFEPPPALTVSEWADTYGRLSRESSSEPGQWYTSRAEYQRGPMDCITNPLIETIVLMWPSQVGKTAVALMAVGYHTEHDPAPILFVEPTLEIAEAVSKDRIAAMIRDTPVLKPLFGDPRSRDSGNTLLHKEFPGGHLTLAGANSAASLASRPIRILITDEEGRYPISAGTEGSPVKLAKKRTATFWNRKHLRISSPNLRKTCSITAAFEKSDQRRFYVPCPQCGHMQTLRWEQLKWPSPNSEPPAKKHEPENCYYVCEENGCVITESDKPAMIAAGQWIAEAPGNGDGKTAGFHLNALYSTLGFSWRDIIDEFLDAKGNPAKLQTFVNTVLAEPWDEQGEGAEQGAIAARAETYSAAAPAWVLVVTAGVDVQKDRIEATKWGFGLNEVSGALEHRIFRGDPAQKAVWAELDAWLAEPIVHETGIRLQTICAFVDSGDGNRTKSVYQYTRSRELRHIFACKGSSLSGAPLVNRGSRMGVYKTLVVSVGVSTAKDDFYSRLKIEERDAPGYVHFPTGLDPEFFSQLTAEVLVARQTKSGEQYVWVKKRRNEALDCAVYARAALEFRRPHMKKIAAQIAAQAAAIKVEAEAAEAARASKKPELGPTKSTFKKRKKVMKLPGAAWIRG
jgi:phage terminase large subunit GpA-like protein